MVEFIKFFPSSCRAKRGSRQFPLAVLIHLHCELNPARRTAFTPVNLLVRAGRAGFGPLCLFLLPANAVWLRMLFAFQLTKTRGRIN